MSADRDYSHLQCYGAYSPFGTHYRNSVFSPICRQSFTEDSTSSYSHYYTESPHHFPSASHPSNSFGNVNYQNELCDTFTNCSPDGFCSHRFYPRSYGSSRYSEGLRLNPYPSSNLSVQCDFQFQRTAPVTDLDRVVPDEENLRPSSSFQNKSPSHGTSSSSPATPKKSRDLVCCWWSRFYSCGTASRNSFK